MFTRDTNPGLLAKSPALVRPSHQPFWLCVVYVDLDFLAPQRRRICSRHDLHPGAPVGLKIEVFLVYDSMI